MASSTPLARYLFNRLLHHNVSHVYGVPGDFTLRALDHLNASGLRFVGCCNELNAGYAADGYSRARRWRHGRGLGALITTYGVGELSAANAVAGSYAEHVPMVHIVGTPSRHTLAMSAASGRWDRSHRQIHHTLGDDRVGVFRDIAEKFTVAQLNLADVTTDQVPDQVEWVLSQALEYSRPVYIELPSDKVDMPVQSQRTQTHHYDAKTSQREIEKAHQVSSDLVRRLYSAKRPMILVDRAAGVEDFREEINNFVRHSGLPTLVLPSGAGMVDGDLPNYYGVHSGKIGYVDSTDFVRSSDLVLAFGGMFSDTQTLGWDTVPQRDTTVLIEKGRIDDTHVRSSEVISNLLQEMDPSRLLKQDTTALGNYRLNEAKPRPSDGLIEQTNFYLALNAHLRPNDTLILANATPILGGRDFNLQPSTQVIVSGMWFSIGHMLPAALGAAQASSNRTILLDGDGSFQVTAQELSTIIHNRVNMTIFIINNGGYTYERLIHGRDEAYNEIAPWDYLAGPKFFGEPPAGYQVHTHRVKTWKDLDEVVQSEHFQKGEGLTLVDVIMDKYDIPEKARVVFENAGKAL
jgi:pyruvate decarboxylase